MTCWVYVLQSEKHGGTYAGISSRLQRRLREHNCGHSRSTKAGRPWKLVFRERCEDHSAARERFLKSGARRSFLDSVLRLDG